MVKDFKRIGVSFKVVVCLKAYFAKPVLWGELLAGCGFFYQ
jgi:hypothetical protein